MRTRCSCILALAALVAAAPAPCEAQFGIIKKAKQAAAQKAEEEAAKRASKAVEKEAGRLDGQADTSAAAPDAQGAAPAGYSASGGAPARADAKVWDNYDFVPGSKVLFFTDFSEDKVGNFARGLKYKAGTMDVVERDGVKMLRSTSRGEFMVPVGAKLPERFTLEIDIIAPKTPPGGYDLIAFEGGSTWDREATSAEIDWSNRGTLIMGGGQTAGTSTVYYPDAMAGQVPGNPMHIRVLMDGPYFKLYSNERRLYNIPELQFKRDSMIRFLVKGGEEAGQEIYVTSIRVAESETDVLYDALMAKGRWATQGILFATGKSDLKPESTPVLKEIASTLTKYSELKILIEGHTDNVGSAASNLALSDARAAAVKGALTTQYGIDEVRITTKGFGDTKPSVPNTTATGRAQNRRVEVVKL
jgi:outer membrane protein OmpA-like peptidoglycan-associated protein